MTICPYCGQDLKVTPAIQQPATQPETAWPYHPQGSPKSHRTRNILIVIVLVAFFAIFFLVPLISTGTSTVTSPENTTSLITYSTTTKVGNSTVTAFTVYLFNGSTSDPLSVDAGYFDYSPFNVTADAMNATVTGNFTASGGLGNDIEVFIMNTTQYDSWYNGNQTSVYYDSGQVTSANINNLKLPAGQSYYLIMDNSFSSISGKTVTGEIILTFTQPTTTMTSTTAQATTTNLQYYINYTDNTS